MVKVILETCCAYQIKYLWFFAIETSVDTEMYCPKGKCGCQYFILLTLKKKKSWT
jgi:hypothetical protein